LSARTGPKRKGPLLGGADFFCGGLVHWGKKTNRFTRGATTNPGVGRNEAPTGATNNTRGRSGSQRGGLGFPAPNGGMLGRDQKAGARDHFLGMMGQRGPGAAARGGLLGPVGGPRAKINPICGLSDRTNFFARRTQGGGGPLKQGGSGQTPRLFCFGAGGGGGHHRPLEGFVFLGYDFPKGGGGGNGGGLGAIKHKKHLWAMTGGGPRFGKGGTGGGRQKNAPGRPGIGGGGGQGRGPHSLLPFAGFLWAWAHGRQKTKQPARNGGICGVG